MNSEFGILYLIPCPISDETAPWDVLPAANRAVMDALDYFIVENTRTARRFLSKAGIARPIGVEVSNFSVQDTNSTSYCLNSSMSFAKSTMERLIRSSL